MLPESIFENNTCHFRLQHNKPKHWFQQQTYNYDNDNFWQGLMK